MHVAYIVQCTYTTTISSNQQPNCIKGQRLNRPIWLEFSIVIDILLVEDISAYTACVSGEIITFSVDLCPRML